MTPNPVARIVFWLPWQTVPLYKTYQTLAEYTADRDLLAEQRGLISLRQGEGIGHSFEEFVSAKAVAQFRLEVFV